MPSKRKNADAKSTPSAATPTSTRATRSTRRSTAAAAAAASKSPTSEVKKQTAAQSLANLFQSEGSPSDSGGKDLVADLMSATDGDAKAAAAAVKGGGKKGAEPKAKKAKVGKKSAQKSQSPPPDVVFDATGVATETKKPIPPSVPVPSTVAAPPVAEAAAAAANVPMATVKAVSKPPAATPRRAAAAGSLAALSGGPPKGGNQAAKKEPASVAVPALPPIAEVPQGGGTVQHDYLLQNLVHASQVSSPLPVQQGKGKKHPPAAGGGVPPPGAAGPPGGPGPVPSIPPGMPPIPGAAPPPGASAAPPQPAVPTKSRKEKSLGVLCQNFMDLFKNCPPNRDNNGTVVEICQVSEHLGVKRRRIYDVINILESIDIVCRVKKNTYRWHGKDGLPGFFASLQKAGLDERARAQAVAAAQAAAAAAGPDAPPPVMPPPVEQPNNVIKTKGMAQTCQKLIQIFLVSGRVDIGLAEAAEEVLGPLSPAEEADAQAAQRAMKTKVRRMYDIANVLQSIGIIQKENVGSTSLQNKPSFRWVYHIPPSDMSNYLGSLPAPMPMPRATQAPALATTQPSILLPPPRVLPPAMAPTVSAEGVASAVAAASAISIPLEDDPTASLIVPPVAPAAAGVAKVAGPPPVADPVAAPTEAAPAPVAGDQVEV